MPRPGAAFSLIEVLATVAIVGVLTAISVPAFTNYLDSGRKAKEVSAARKLVAGYLGAAADRDGYLPEGYAAAGTTTEDQNGETIHFPASARYAWRLAPYVDWDMHTILFNGNEKALKEGPDDHYAISVASNLGINAMFVGGDFGPSSELPPEQAFLNRFGNFCVMRSGQATKPSTLIVFVSARRSEKEIGRFSVTPPALTGQRWTASRWDPKAPASAYGFVDMRYNGRAVAAMLDGHVELLDEEQLRDMRRWSNQAAEQDDPRFTLQRARR